MGVKVRVAEVLQRLLQERRPDSNDSSRALPRKHRRISFSQLNGWVVRLGGEIRGLLRGGRVEASKYLLEEGIEVVLVAEAGFLPGSVGFWRAGFARVEEGVASWEGRHVGGNAIEACCCDCRCDGYQGGHDNEMGRQGGRSGKQLNNVETEIGSI